MELIGASRWDVPDAPVLGDCAYGDKTELRARLDFAGRQYVLGISADTSVFAPETTFEVPEPRKTGKGRQKTRLRPDRKPEQVGALIARQPGSVWRAITFRDGPDGEPMTSRFCFLRVRAGNEWEKANPFPPREEWLIAEWPEGREQPTTTGSPTCPPTPSPNTSPASPGCAGRSPRLQAAQGRARTGSLRGPLLAWLVSPHRARHRRARIPRARAIEPFSPAAGLTLPQAVRLLQPIFQMLDRPLSNLPTASQH